MGTKAGKVILGGIGAYLILSKGIRALQKLIEGAEEAVKWKAYYRYGNEHMVPPGYRQTTKKDGETCDFTPGDENGGTSQDAQNEALKASIKEAIDNTFNRPDALKRPLEGQIEAFKEDKSLDTESTDEKCEKCGKCTCHEDPKIYEITREEFFHGMTRNVKVINYYEEDDIFIEDNSYARSDISAFAGDIDVRKLFDTESTDDPDIRFIRNEKDHTDYEFIRWHMSYSQREEENTDEHVD